MKRKCCPIHHHSKHCKCDGTQRLPNVLALWFIRNGIKYHLVTVGLSKFSDGTEKWYVYFKPPSVSKHRINITRMGVGAWRYNVRANRADLFPEAIQ